MKHGLLVLVLSLVSIFSNAQSYPLVPDPKWTTGDICTTDNPDFTEYRYPEKIVYCKRSVSSKTKKVVYNNYKIEERCRGYYTIDHFIPLSIGGTNEMTNLWPEHVNVKATRPRLEQELFEDLKNARITQKEAIDEIIMVKTTPVIPFNLEAVMNGCN